jgi:hypothetical protein
MPPPMPPRPHLYFDGSAHSGDRTPDAPPTEEVPCPLCGGSEIERAGHG